MKVLIVGGAGYIGSAVVEIMHSHPHVEVAVLDNLVFEDDYLDTRVEFIHCDILDYPKINSIVQNYDVLVWLAGVVGEPACNASPDHTVRVNVEAFANICENYKGHLIYTSTCSVYGVAEDICTEESPVNPLSLYAETKVDCEKILADYPYKKTLLRLGTLFGASANPIGRVRLDLGVNMIAYFACAGGVKVYGLEQFRPFVHVMDVAMAINFIIDYAIEGTYIVSNFNYQMANIANDVNNAINGEVNITEVPYDIVDKRDYQADNSKFVALGFEYKYPLSVGIAEMGTLAISQRIKNAAGPKYHNGKFYKNLVESLIIK